MQNLLVASTGGHLLELFGLRTRMLPKTDGVVWVTSDSKQSRSLLAGEEVIFVPEVVPRGYRAVATNARGARRVLRETGAEQVISTGAGIALAFLPLARATGLQCHYIESAARMDGPSMTGRLLRSARAAHLYAQHAEWAQSPWLYQGSVFDDLEVLPRRSTGRIRRVVVTLGTLHYPFDRLVRCLQAALPSDAEVLWQLGFEPGIRLSGRVERSLDHHELAAEMEGADLVVCHGGVGSALLAFSVGQCPVLVPRRVAFGEHVDDHQSQVASMLAERGLAVTCEADELQEHHLQAAAALRIRTTDHPHPFMLARQG